MDDLTELYGRPRVYHPYHPHPWLHSSAVPDFMIFVQCSLTACCRSS